MQSNKKYAAPSFIAMTEKGVLFAGFTFAEIAEKMFASAVLPGTDLTEYMHEVARRTMIYNECTVRTDSAENFILDLYDAGILVQVR